MDIFKLFYNHDQRLEELRERSDTPSTPEATLEDFMKPDPTFSRFYLTGTRLTKQKFGIDQLNKFPQILLKLDWIFEGCNVHTSSKKYPQLSEAIKETPVGGAIIITKQPQVDVDIETLGVGDESYLGHIKDELREVLKNGHKVIYKEQAKNGFDLHLFSKENIYPRLFHPLQMLVDESFRFFSINSKRMRSERHFYFETWTLDNPPHGAEEVFSDTVLRSKQAEVKREK